MKIEITLGQKLLRRVAGEEVILFLKEVNCKANNQSMVPSLPLLGVSILKRSLQC
jgi:hypothetical protein